MQGQEEQDLTERGPRFAERHHFLPHCRQGRSLSPTGTPESRAWREGGGGWKEHQWAWEGALGHKHGYLEEKLPRKRCLKDTTEGQHHKAVRSTQSSRKGWGQGREKVAGSRKRGPELSQPQSEQKGAVKCHGPHCPAGSPGEMDLFVCAPESPTAQGEGRPAQPLHNVQHAVVSLAGYNAPTNAMCAPLGQMPQLVKCSGVSSARHLNGRPHTCPSFRPPLLYPTWSLDQVRAQGKAARMGRGRGTLLQLERGGW